jgi:hypothetical protein
LWINGEEMQESAGNQVVSWPAKDEYAGGKWVWLWYAKIVKVVVAEFVRLPGNEICMKSLQKGYECYEQAL